MFIQRGLISRANLDGSRQVHIETTIWPLVQRFEDVLNEQLVGPRYGENVFVVHENPIPEDVEARRAERQSKLISGWSINEVRLDEGEDPGHRTQSTPKTASWLRSHR